MIDAKKHNAKYKRDQIIFWIIMFLPAIFGIIKNYFF